MAALGGVGARVTCPGAAEAAPGTAPTEQSQGWEVAVAAAEPAKIVCSGLWKIYGPAARQREGATGQPTQFELDGLAARPGHIAAVRDVSFDVHPGRIFVIMGLSGSGKSTVLRCLSRLVEPTAGEVIIDDRNILGFGRSELIHFRRHKIGMVFQNFGLLPHLTVIENVAYPLRVQGIPREARLTHAREMIDLVGLAGRENSYPRELSGGQQQRVGIARSLAVGPDLWLLDEPFSALDPLIRRQMQDEFLRLHRMMQKTIVFVTHDFLEALRIADRIAIMRDGRIVQVGRPAELVLNPVDEYVAQFTRDAPRERFLTAGDVAQPQPEPRPAASRIPGTTPLRDVIQRLAADGAPLTVVDDRSGAALGEITRGSLLGTLAGRPGNDDRG